MVRERPVHECYLGNVLAQLLHRLVEVRIIEHLDLPALGTRLLVGALEADRFRRAGLRGDRVAAKLVLALECERRFLAIEKAHAALEIWDEIERLLARGRD